MPFREEIQADGVIRHEEALAHRRRVIKAVLVDNTKGGSAANVPVSREAAHQEAYFGPLDFRF